MCNIQSYGKQIDTRKSTWTRIKAAHAAQQIISISIVGTVVIFDFKTLKSVSFQLSILLYVFFSYKFVFWSKTERKEEKTTLMILENGPTKYFHIYLWDCGQLKSISILWSPFFQLRILSHISSSFVRSTRVYWIEDGTKRMKKNKPTTYGDRRHFELCLLLHVLRQKSRP